MALSPIVPLMVQWEAVLVDVQPASLYGSPHDVAMINTSMMLQSPAVEDVIFALPALDAPAQAPVLRVVAETPGVAAEFEETTYDTVDRELRQAFAQARRDDREFFRLLRQEAQTMSWARVEIDQGDSLVRFHYPAKVPQVEPGVFEFRVLAPLSSFVLNGGGGEISFTLALPRVPGRTVQLVSAVAENPPGQPGTPLTEQATLAQRLFLGHYLRLDPLYVIRYRYA